MAGRRELFGLCCLLAGVWQAAEAQLDDPAITSLVITPEAFVEGDPNTYAVFNGSHTRAYDPVAPAATVHARSEVVAFLMQSAGAPLWHGASRVVSSDPSACAASLSGPALSIKRIGRQARRLFVNVDCVAPRETSVTVSVSLEVRVGAVGAATTVSFGFKKMCAGDAPVPGFDVTLGPLAGAADESRESVGVIVRNGETRTAYLPEGPSARVTYDTADVHVHITTANASLVAEHAFGPPTATCSAKWCRVLLSGPAAKGGVSRRARPELLVLKFDCSGSGTAQATITLPLLLRAEPLRFALLKECRAGAIPGFDVTLSSYEPGVRASYALNNGAATPGYHAVGDGSGLAVVREAQSQVSFYLQMSNFRTLQFEPPVVRSSDPFCLVNVAGDASNGGWVDDISSQLTISFNCIDSGTATITVSVPLALDEQRVNASFAFKKECRWTSTPGFDVALGAWVRRDGPGADDNGAYAVRNGAATALFAPLGPKAVVAPRQYSSLFYVQMSTNEEQAFGWPKAESSDAGTARVSLAGPASEGGLARPFGARAPTQRGLALVAKYDCLKTGSATITVTIPLGPWNEAAFAFQKECIVGEIPGLDVGLGAWVPGDYHSYAVKNGAPTEPYDPSAHVAIIRAATPSYTFYLSNSAAAPLTAHAPSVQVSNPAVSVTVTGDATTPGPLERGARSLVLTFSCTARTKTDVVVSLRVGAGTVAFGFRKDCKPLTTQHQEADTPHEVLRQAERISSRDGPSGRFGALLFGVAIGLLVSQFAAKLFSPVAKGYQRAKESD